MLVIRNEQLAVLVEVVREQFVDRVTDWLGSLYPSAAMCADRETLRSFVRDGVRQANARGFRAEIDVARVVRATFLLGLDTARLADEAWAGGLLDPTSTRLPSFRSEQLLDGAMARASTAAAVTLDQQGEP